MPNSGEETTLNWHVQPGQDANGAAAEALRRLLAGFLSAETSDNDHAASVTWIHVVSQFWLCPLYPTLFLLDLSLRNPSLVSTRGQDGFSPSAKEPKATEGPKALDLQTSHLFGDVGLMICPTLNLFEQFQEFYCGISVSYTWLSHINETRWDDFSLSLS